MDKKTIFAEIPYESKFVEIMGSKMHYRDEGEGDPILFLHGNPTSNYLWRNVMPHMKGQGRLIAPDLIGMGKSGKPSLGYTFEEHYSYLEAFIKKLDLKNITLVLHDWGSGLGFHYANMNHDNVKGIAFMEAVFQPMNRSNMPKKMVKPFKMMRTNFIGWLMISVGNMFVKKMIPEMIVRKLSKEEFDQYKSPYPTIASRKPVRIWPMEIPIDGKPKRVFDKVDAYSKWLEKTKTPKLCIYVSPGAIIKEKEAKYISENFTNTKMVDVGEGTHFIQEDHPHEIGKAISDWIKENKL